MEENQFDRQAYAAQARRPPRPSNSLAGLLLFVALVGLLGFAGYKFVEANGMRAFGGNDPSLADIAQKLEEIEQRLDQLEKRQRRGVAEPSPPATKTAQVSESGSPLPAPAAPSRAFVVGRRSPGTASGSNPPDDKRLSHLQRDFGTLQSDVSANREAWEATTDRLGQAVGELGTHRGEIANLKQLMDRFERIQLPFDLTKRMERHRIGPVYLWLRGTDPKTGRYTLRVFVDDRWVELKDRALNEPVEFYLSGVSVPLELVVSEVHSDRVVGTLAVPEEALER